ncbi:DinB family protein [Streptomyces silaceus]|uniref:DinB family protein n=1 Tax=Streptomyces silaceus TaxID=545123 RepID=UPI0006EB71A8|nr:DinB family protein [Streptomyces silaceus]
MIDDAGKEHLHNRLRGLREAMLWKLDGLGEYDIRRPLTSTGTNLLGLVKHLAVWESRYFGEVVGRPFPEDLPRWDDEAASGTDLWATEHESREDIIGLYRRVWAHADATIAAHSLDSPGHVPWWPQPDVQLFNILVHLLSETSRHAGHADILREQLDGSTGTTAAHVPSHHDAASRQEQYALIERAAKAAVPDRATPSPTS